MDLKYKFDAPKNGIDVSKYQGNVNWNEVKNAGYEFAFVRLGYANSDGTIVIDPYFDRNMRSATDAGLMWAYICTATLIAFLTQKLQPLKFLSLFQNTT